MNKFLAAVFAATLLSTTALAGITVVAKPGEKTITLVCSSDVLPGTVVLSNPPKVNCKDFGLAKALIGTGVTIGPDVNVDRIARAVRRATREKRNTRVTPLPVKTARGFLSRGLDFRNSVRTISANICTAWTFMVTWLRNAPTLKRVLPVGVIRL